MVVEATRNIVQRNSLLLGDFWLGYAIFYRLEKLWGLGDGFDLE